VKEGQRESEYSETFTVQWKQCQL